MTGKTERNSSFELLRILSMLMIIGLHYYNLGFVIPEDEPISFNYLLIRFVSFGGRVGVDMFVLISGYFLVEQKFRAQRLVRLWLQVTLLSLPFAVFYYIRGAVGFRSVIKCFFYVFNNMHWFITAYFMLYLFSDYISAMLRAIGRKGHFSLMCLLLAVYSVLPTCFGMRMDSSNFMLFVTLYVIAAYIRLYSPKLLESKYCLPVGVLFLLLCYVTSMLLYSLNSLNSSFGHLSERMTAATDVTVILSAVLIFAGFRNLDIGHSKLINALGASTLGVYLLHMSPYFQHDLWVTILHTPDFLHSKWLILHAPLSILGVFLVCAAVDMLFRRFILDPLMRCIDRHWDSWGEKLRRHLPASDGQ